jgi:hypothetical protein
MRRISVLAVIATLLAAAAPIAAALLRDWQSLIVCSSIAGVVAAVLSLREDR